MLGGNENGPQAAGSPSLQRTVLCTHGLFCLSGLECPTLYRTQSPSSPAELRQLLDCGESLHGTVNEDKLTFLFQMARPPPPSTQHLKSQRSPQSLHSVLCSVKLAMHALACGSWVQVWVCKCKLWALNLFHPHEPLGSAGIFRNNFLTFIRLLSLPGSSALISVSSYSYGSPENILSLHHLTGVSWCPLTPSQALSLPPGLLAFFLAHLLTFSCHMSIE